VHAYQWFLLGMMFAWTPGLLVLAVMLRRRDRDDSEVRSRPIPAASWARSSAVRRARQFLTGR
jgi:hypothetical protein